jgi:hypothetical protein
VKPPPIGAFLFEVDMNEKRYLGDAVYACWSNFGDLMLTTEDGINVTNKIYLEPEVLNSLMNFIKETSSAR